MNEYPEMNSRDDERRERLIQIFEEDHELFDVLE